MHPCLWSSLTKQSSIVNYLHVHCRQLFSSHSDEYVIFAKEVRDRPDLPALECVQPAQTVPDAFSLLARKAKWMRDSDRKRTPPPLCCLEHRSCGDALHSDANVGGLLLTGSKVNTHLILAEVSVKCQSPAELNLNSNIFSASELQVDLSWHDMRNQKRAWTRLVYCTAHNRFCEVDRCKRCLGESKLFFSIFLFLLDSMCGVFLFMTTHHCTETSHKQKHTN